MRMNIILFVNKDLQANIAYNLLKPTLAQHNVRVYYTADISDPNKRAAAYITLQHYEKTFFYRELQAFIAEQGITPSFEFFGPGFTSAELIECQKLNTTAFREAVQAFAPDLFVSIRFGKIFKPKILALPRLGVLNLHSGLLPQYRGVLGTLYALLSGTIGSTLHYITDGTIDTGPIIATHQQPETLGRSLFWQVTNLYAPSMPMVAQAIDTLAGGGTLATTPQNPEKGNYFTVPTAAHFSQLYKRRIAAISLIDYYHALTSHVLTDLAPTQQASLQQHIIAHQLKHNHQLVYPQPK